jgi:hypothetical protein
MQGKGEVLIFVYIDGVAAVPFSIFATLRNFEGKVKRNFTKCRFRENDQVLRTSSKPFDFREAFTVFSVLHIFSRIVLQKQLIFAKTFLSIPVIPPLAARSSRVSPAWGDRRLLLILICQTENKIGNLEYRILRVHEHDFCLL